MATGFDPEAEQEVDFARYVRMLARRWWLVLIGVVVGAVIGYLVSLGGAQVYSATATIYLGQPYNGTTPIVTLQTNPSAVGQIVNSQAVDMKVATQCNTNVESFRKGISVQKIVTSSTPTKATAQVNPLVTVSVQAAKEKVATCAANGLAKAAVAGIAAYPDALIKNLESRIAGDNTVIQALNAQLADPSISDVQKSTVYLKLPTLQADLSTSSQGLILAKQVEMPSVTLPAAARKVTAQSSHNTVTIAALIGLVLGILGALLWDRIVPARTAS